MISRAFTIFVGLVLLIASLVVIPGLVPLLYGLAAWASPSLSTTTGWVIAVVLSLLVPAGVLLASWDRVPTTGSWGAHPTIRGDTWRPLRWLIQTMDERLPGGLYEPTVEKILARFGRVICSLYWLGWRNRAHGLRRYVSKPSYGDAGRALFGERFEEVDGVAKGTRADGSWYYSRKLGPVKFVCGHRVYQMLDMHTYLPVPTCTIKRA